MHVKRPATRDPMDLLSPMKLVPLKTYGLGEPTEGPIFQQNCTAVSSYSVGWLTRKVAPASVLKPTIAFLHLHLKRFMQLRSPIISNLLRTGPNPICFFQMSCPNNMFINCNHPNCASWCFLISLGICVFFWCVQAASQRALAGAPELRGFDVALLGNEAAVSNQFFHSSLFGYCFWGLVTSKMNRLLYVHTRPYTVCCMCIHIYIHIMSAHICMYKKKYRIVSWRHKYCGYKNRASVSLSCSHVF